MPGLARAAAVSALATVALAAAGVVRVKLYAVYLGTAGMGVIAQVQNLLNVLTVVGMLGVGIGISREVARARGAGGGGTAQVGAMRRTAGMLTGVASLLLALGMAAAARPLARLLLNDPGAAWLFVLAAPSLLFITGWRNLLHLIQGFGSYATRTRGSVVLALLSVGFAVPLVWGFGVPGAVGAVALSWGVGLWVLHALFRRVHPEAFAPGHAGRAAARVLLGLGGLSLAVAAAEQVALLVVRSRLIHLHGVEANGLFQGVWGLSQYVLETAVAFLPAYAFARVHGTTDRALIRAETDKALRMTLLLVAPMAAGVILLRGPLVRAFLSPEFEAALPLFPFQATGDLLQAMALAVGLAILGVAPGWTWLLCGLGSSAGFIGAFWLLSPRLGVAAAPAGYAVSGLVHLLLAGAVMRRWAGLRLSSRVIVLAAASVLLLLGMIWVSREAGGAAYGWGGVLLLLWGVLAVRPAELKALVAEARDGWSRRGE